MEARIVFYRQDELDQNTKFRLRRDLLGLEQKSNFSRYKYKINGILDKLDHYRPVNSTIIVKKKDIKQVKEVLRKYNTKYEVFVIKIPRNKLVKK